MNVRRLVLLILISMSMFFTSAPVPALAANFTVNAAFDAVDANPGDGQCRIALTQRCTLRAAIQETNALPGPDTITVPAGTYTLTIAGKGENAAASGDLDITGNLTINGTDAETTIVDGGALDTVFDILPGRAVNISAITIRNGRGAGYPGGVDNEGNLTMTDCVIADNTATTGNAGGAWNSGTMTLRRCQVLRNRAYSNGGGLFNRYGTLNLDNSTVSGNTATRFDGGGIANNLGTLILNNSAVSENQTQSNEGNGGGIWNDSSLTVTGSTINFNRTYGDGGGIWNTGSLAMVNSTISRNTSVDNTGGGIYNRGASANLNNVTITENIAPGGGGGINNAAGTLNFKNTILARNFLVVPALLNDCAGTLNSQGHNLIRILAGCVIAGNPGGNIIGVDPLLWPLADNGGPTWTHALRAGSPARNAGNPTAPGSGGDACLLTDQRGVPRPQEPRCDIGAYEG